MGRDGTQNRCDATTPLCINLKHRSPRTPVLQRLSGSVLSHPPKAERVPAPHTRADTRRARCHLPSSPPLRSRAEGTAPRIPPAPRAERHRQRQATASGGACRRLPRHGGALGKGTKRRSLPAAQHPVGGRYLPGSGRGRAVMPAAEARRGPWLAAVARSVSELQRRRPASCFGAAPLGSAGLGAARGAGRGGAGRGGAGAAGGTAAPRGTRRPLAGAGAGRGRRPLSLLARPGLVEAAVRDQPAAGGRPPLRGRRGTARAAGCAGGSSPGSLPRGKGTGVKIIRSRRGEERASTRSPGSENQHSCAGLDRGLGSSGSRPGKSSGRRFHNFTTTAGESR